MKYFRADNTEGYTEAELIEANELLEAALNKAQLDPDSDGYSSELAYLGERILADYDTRLAARALGRKGGAAATEAQRAAARRNGLKGGRPAKQTK